MEDPCAPPTPTSVWLRCNACRWPLCYSVHLLPDRAVRVKTDSVYAYELENFFSSHAPGVTSEGRTRSSTDENRKRRQPAPPDQKKTKGHVNSGANGVAGSADEEEEEKEEQEEEEEDMLWAYRVSNPTETSFDIIRLHPSAQFSAKNNGGLRCVPDAATTDFTFFPPYAWRGAECVACGAFVGWGFFDDESEEAENQQQATTAVGSSVDAEPDTEEENDEATPLERMMDAEGVSAPHDGSASSPTTLAFFALVLTNVSAKLCPEQRFLESSVALRTRNVFRQAEARTFQQLVRPYSLD